MVARALGVNARSESAAAARAPTSQDALNFISSLESREKELIEREKDQKQKLRIAAIAAQQLHIYSPDQMTAFCKKFWEIFRVMAEAAAVTAVAREAGKKPRLGPVARVVAAHESHKNGK
jgi:hypothetical protein